MRLALTALLAAVLTTTVTGTAVGETPHDATPPLGGLPHSRGDEGPAASAQAGHVVPTYGASASAGASCTWSFPFSWTGSESFDARAWGSIANVAGTYTASGRSTHVPPQNDAGAWPLDHDAHVSGDWSGDLDLGATIEAEAKAQATSLLGAPSTAQDSGVALCKLPIGAIIASTVLA